MIVFRNILHAQLMCDPLPDYHAAFLCLNNEVKQDFEYLHKGNISNTGNKSQFDDNLTSVSLIRDHAFSTFSRFSEKLTFTP